MRISDWSSDVCSSDLSSALSSSSWPWGFPPTMGNGGMARARPVSRHARACPVAIAKTATAAAKRLAGWRMRRDTPSYDRSEEHTSELQSLMRTSYAVFCLKKKTKNQYGCTTTRHVKRTDA